MTSVWVGGGYLAAHCVGVAAPAAGPCGPVVGTLAEGKAQPGRGVAAEAGQTEGHQGHGAPASADVGRGAGAGPVGAVILIVLGRTVVEQAFDAAQARTVLHDGLGRAEAALSTGPAGRKTARAAALLALTATAPLTDERVEAEVHLVVCQDFTERSVRLQLSFRLTMDH